MNRNEKSLNKNIYSKVSFQRNAKPLGQSIKWGKKFNCQNNSDYNRNPKVSEKKPFPSSYPLLNSQLDYISQASLHLDMAMCLNFSQWEQKWTRSLLNTAINSSCVFLQDFPFLLLECWFQGNFIITLEDSRAAIVLVL